MPRGYLRNQRYNISRKECRGGQSQHGHWARTPGFLRREKAALRRQKRNIFKCNYDADIQDGLNEFYDDDLYPDFYHDDMIHDDLETSSMISHGDDEANCTSNVDAASVDYTDKSYFNVGSYVTNQSYEIKRRQDIFAHSIGNDNSHASSESFSLVSVANDNESHDGFSSATSQWDIVQETPEGFVDDFVGCSTIRDDDYVDDSFSMVSGLSDSLENPNLKTQTQNDAPLRLFVPKKCAICLSEKKDVLRLMHKCNHPAACMSCLRTNYLKNGVIHHYQQRTKYSAEDFAFHLPLKCFWPGCKGTLRDKQIRSLAKNERNVMDMYYELEWMRKGVGKWKRKPMAFGFLKQVSLYEIISIVEAMGDCLVKCPRCGALITKDGGCDHMTCLCGQEFSFASTRKGQIFGCLKNEINHLPTTTPKL
mmetsp:Transcript_19661/g.29545  ORF Transcript_19661/g.29545 Transcript_19661/m.29545 type:complete len:422 (+) Transcript_19661:48-1313(+)